MLGSGMHYALARGMFKYTGHDAQASDSCTQFTSLRVVLLVLYMPPLDLITHGVLRFRCSRPSIRVRYRMPTYPSRAFAS